MKKFECYECTAEATKYITYKGWISGKNYYECYCSACIDKLDAYYREITLDEFIAAKAMEVL